MGGIDGGGTLKYAVYMGFDCRVFMILGIAGAVAMSHGAGSALADMGRVGKSNRVFSIREEAENKRIRDQVERVLTMRERKAQAAAAKAARDEQRSEAPAARAEQAAAAAVPEPLPAMTIVFNRNHVHFDRDMRHMLEASERSQRTAHYDVVSEVPAQVSGGRRNQRILSEYEENLARVVSSFAEMGVHGSRISIVSRPSDKVIAQTVKIYQN